MPRPTYDRDYKDVIARWPKESVWFLFPEEAAKLPANTEYVMLRQETRGTRRGGRFYELDAPIMAKYGKRRDQFSIYVPEHHSKGVIDDVLKAGGYAIELARDYKTSRIHLKLLYQNDGPAPHEFKIGDERHTSVHINFEVLRLSKMNARDYAGSENNVANLFSVAMKMNPAEREDLLKCAFRRVKKSARNKTDLRLYWGFISKYGKITDKELPRLLEGIGQDKEYIMTLFEQFQAKGKAEGIKLGVSKGEAKGLLEGLTAQANQLLEMMNEGILTPAQARAKLMAMRTKGPLNAKAADAALAIIGDREY